MFLPISAGLVEPTPFKRLQMHKSNPNSSDDIGAFHSQLIIEIDASTHTNDLSNDYNQEKGWNNDDDDQYIKLRDQTHPTITFIPAAKSHIENQRSLVALIPYDQYEELNTIIKNTNMMETFVRQNPLPSQLHRDSASNRLSETSDVVVLTTSDLLSYQDVMNAIEREFHLHAGQEREIIMKLWLKGQTMLSILQRFRHLLQDLNLDDKNFVAGLKQIREMVNYSDRDVHYLREYTTMLENQNRFLENEFQRQLDKIAHEKNEQISRLIHVIDQTCSPPTEYKDRPNDDKHASGNEELLKKFTQQNVELHREIETLRAKLEYTFTFINGKLDQHKISGTSPYVSVIQTAFEEIRQTEMQLQELKLKSTSQQEENDLLKYLIEKSQRVSDIEQTQLFTTIERHSLQREIDRVRHELEITETKTAQFEQRFENSDETVQFHIEKLKLKCDVLRKHIHRCSQRLDEFNQIEFKNENQIQKNHIQQHESDNGRKVIRLETELRQLRERNLELMEHSNTLTQELNNLRKQVHEKVKFESTSNTDLDQERRRANQLENELKSLKIKYDDVCERISGATHKLEHVQNVLDQTSRRCEQLEKEKSEINAQSEYLSQNVANVTSKYKDKLSSTKSRLEQTERDRRETQTRCEQFQNEIERLKNELTHKKEIIFEKDKTIQDAQYKNREILHERQSVEERITNECKRLSELVDKNRLLEEELDRIRRNDIIPLRRTEKVTSDSSTNDTSKNIEELRLKINEFEQRFEDEKLNKESLQLQIKILEEENADLREFMTQMRKRTHVGQKDERDRRDEIQQLIARAELNARQYMTNFNLTSLTTPSTLGRIVPLSSPTKIS